MDELPRPTFKRAADKAVELEVSAIVCKWLRASYFPIGRDDPRKHKSHIDGVFERGGIVVGFAEIKSTTYLFEDSRLPWGWSTSRRKVDEARALFDLVRVPVVILIRFGCGTIAYLNVDEDKYIVHRTFGRTDRNSGGDIEVGARFLWSQMRIIRRGNSVVIAPPRRRRKAAGGLPLFSTQKKSADPRGPALTSDPPDKAGENPTRDLEHSRG